MDTKVTLTENGTPIGLVSAITNLDSAHGVGRLRDGRYYEYRNTDVPYVLYREFFPKDLSARVISQDAAEELVLTCRHDMPVEGVLALYNQVFGRELSLPVLSDRLQRGLMDQRAFLIDAVKATEDWETPWSSLIGLVYCVANLNNKDEGIGRLNDGHYYHCMIAPYRCRHFQVNFYLRTQWEAVTIPDDDAKKIVLERNPSVYDGLFGIALSVLD